MYEQWKSSVHEEYRDVCCDYGNATLAGLPASQLRRLQSVLNAAARQLLVAVFGTHRFQVGCARLLMPAWPGAAVSFRLHPARRRLQQPPSSVVITLAACDPTYTAVHCRQCVFPVAGSRLWNSLPPDITSAPTLTVSRNRLKTYLFFRSFPN